MKLLYATSITYPSFLTNRIQIMRMAEELQKNLQEGFILGGRNIVLGNGEKINIKNLEGSPRSYILSLKYLLFAKKNEFIHIY